MRELICFLWDQLPKRWFHVDERFIVKDGRLIHVKSHLLFLYRRVLTVPLEGVPSA